LQVYRWREPFVIILFGARHDETSLKLNTVFHDRTKVLTLQTRSSHGVSY
jgi:hypothetical protein